MAIGLAHGIALTVVYSDSRSWSSVAGLQEAIPASSLRWSGCTPPPVSSLKDAPKFL